MFWVFFAVLYVVLAAVAAATTGRPSRRSSRPRGGCRRSNRGTWRGSPPSATSACGPSRAARAAPSAADRGRRASRRFRTARSRPGGRAQARLATGPLTWRPVKAPRRRSRARQVSSRGRSWVIGLGPSVEHLDADGVGSTALNHRLEDLRALGLSRAASISSQTRRRVGRSASVQLSGEWEREQASWTASKRGVCVVTSAPSRSWPWHACGGCRRRLEPGGA